MNVYGNKPNKFESRIMINRLVRILHHFCPSKDSGLVMFNIMVLRSQVIAVVIRFPRSRGLW